jgi:molybdopterin-guanine dinucleotide biosynthesis protein MobB
MPSIPVLCIVGRSGSGKTTMLEKLIPELKRRGYRVATIKHHFQPGFEIDQPGKDSWRHAQAGSDHVILVAPDKVASIRRVDQEPTLDEIAATIQGVDIILAEGYKWAAKPKIEVVRAARSTEIVSPPEDLLAIVSDLALPVGDVPRFDLEDGPGLADLIESHFLSGPSCPRRV